MLRTLLLAGAALALLSGAASAKDLKAVGVTVGSLGNPYFVNVGKGVTDAVHEINPQAKVTVSSADYDLNKQFTQIDNFIAAGVDLILVNAADPRAIAPAIKRAQAAGIAVVGVDVAAAGADATVQTDNTRPGEISCKFMADAIGGKGNVVIENGPQVSAVIDRVNGCKKVLGGFPDIKLLSSDQDGKGSRDGGLNVMQGYLTASPASRACSPSTTRRPSAATSRPSSSTGAASSSPRWTAPRHRGRAEGPDAGAGVGEPGPLRDGQARGEDRV